MDFELVVGLLLRVLDGEELWDTDQHPLCINTAINLVAVGGGISLQRKDFTAQVKKELKQRAETYVLRSDVQSG